MVYVGLPIFINFKPKCSVWPRRKFVVGAKSDEGRATL